MKLYELISTMDTIKTSKAPFDFDKANKKYSAERDGPDSGSFALATADKKDPHMYDKKHYYPSRLKNDAYYQYIKSIRDISADNPYFPRVYNISVNKTSDGNETPSYKIEALKKAREFSKEALMGLANRIYDNFEIEFYGRFGAADQDRISGLLVSNISYAAQNGDMDKITDEYLVQALRHIEKVKNSNNTFSWDLHKENVLFRGTPNGPQLVLIDPLFDSGRDSQIKS